jgi:lysophospholipase L1-like esterase
MPWRSYSTRSSFPLARSSQTRRRLLLFQDFGVAPHDGAADAASPTVPPPEVELQERESAFRALWSDDPSAAPDPPTVPVESSDASDVVLEDDVLEVREFLDEAFEPSEARNERLAAGSASASVLDDDEDEQHTPGGRSDRGGSDDSLIASLLGESRIIARDPGESRVLQLSDMAEVPETIDPSDEPAEPHFPDWYVPTFRTIKRLLERDRPVTWVFTGDSLTGGASDRGERGERALGRQSFAEQFSERVRHELGRALDVVIDTAAMGATVRQVGEELPLRVTRFQPEVVILLTGLSESRAGADGLDRFRSDLKDVVRRIRERGAAVVLQTPPGIEPPSHPEFADLPAYVDAVREVVEELKLPCVDHWAHWHEAKPHPAERVAWLSADGVHPGVYGHREMAKLIFRRFGIFDESSPLCAARVP